MIKIPFSPPDISDLEINEVIDTLKSGWITTGPKVKQFERELAEWCHTNRTVCLNSATAALELILRVLGIGPGDEVITSAYTYTASASPALHVGAKIVLVDTAPDSYEMDYEALEKAITPSTKVIIPVDIGGIICDYQHIFEIVKRQQYQFRAANKLQQYIGRICVVADCAHAFGAMRSNLIAGQIADFSSFSFHAVKNLTTAEGGFATWRDIEGIDNEELYHQFQLLSLHGQSKDALAKTQLGSWEYDIISPAYKCNMTDIMAAIGLSQLKRYSGLISHRQQIIAMYNKRLEPLGIKTLQHKTNDSLSSGHLYLTRIPDISIDQRNEIIVKMAERGIACNVHYKPLPMMTAYKNLGFDIADFHNAYKQFSNEISLPLHTLLTNEQVAYILDNYLEVLHKYGV